MKESVIAAHGFSKRYRQQLAVDALDLTVHRGELFGLIGPDGAGKSSLMKAIAGVLALDAGTLSVFGIELDSEKSAERIKGRIGLMPQGLGQNLYGELSIEENVDFFARLRLVPHAIAQARKEKLLQVTRLWDFRARPMKQLSGGMKQKLGLVCTLIHAPELIILDEPTTGVDPVSRRDFWTILAELIATEGLTALVSTAYMDEASRFDRMVLLDGGQPLAVGTPQQILARMPGSVVLCGVSEQVEAIARLVPRFPQCEVLGPALRVFAQGLDADAAQIAVKGLLTGLTLGVLSTQDAELEDVFVALMRAQGGIEPLQFSPSDTRVAEWDGPAIEAAVLTKRFGDFIAVSDVSFTVRQGEIFGLLGANGAGKTTAIKMLTGILPPSSGQGRVAGADMKRAGSLIKQRIGYMSQAFSLYLDLTVAENIRLYAGLYGLGRRERAQRLDWVVEMAGLSSRVDTLAASLPMGLRQRLALGCALVHRPRVLFLDEPTSGVDPLGRRAFWDILFRLSRIDGVAMLVTTHYMSEAEHCDHLALMFAGRVVADASPGEMKAQVLADAGALYEVEGDGAPALLPALSAAGFGHVSVYGNKLHVLTPDEPALRHAVAALAPALRVQARPISMEDVFVHRVGMLEKERQS